MQLDAELQVEQSEPQRVPIIAGNTLGKATPIRQRSWGRARIRAGLDHFARRNLSHTRGSVWGRLQGSTARRDNT